MMQFPNQANSNSESEDTMPTLVIILVVIAVIALSAAFVFHRFMTWLVGMMLLGAIGVHPRLPGK